MADQTAAPLPTAELKDLAAGVSLLPPLSRRGYGPGMIILLPNETPSYTNGGTECSDGIPPPVLKWAEEGFAVVQILEATLEQATNVNELFELAISTLKSCEQCHEEDGIGLVVYDAPVWNRIASKVTLPSLILAAVFYASAAEPAVPTTLIPYLQHIVGASASPSTQTLTSKSYCYPKEKSSKFAIPGLKDFHYSAEAVSHTRNLTFIKKYIRGADFDLEAIWEEHTYFEFEDRSVSKTMATMVQEPYVNHIPTITGGIGRSLLSNFYRDHFIFNNPKDTGMEIVSRTIGIDRVCDEFIFSMTHDSEVDWLIPGIPPTGKILRIPFIAVVNIRGDRLYHEHITWDQASVLKQLDLLPEYLPYPHPLPNGKVAASGKRFEYKIPATGVDTALKMLDKNAVASNAMFDYKLREVDI